METRRTLDDSFAVFVLSHGRPANVITWETLDKTGYTGRRYLVVDNEDETADEYRARFGPERVLEFDKAAIAETFDTADVAEDRRSVVYARNACYQLARELGVSRFLELDDDYIDLLYRWIDDDGARRSAMIRDLDATIAVTLRFQDDSGAAVVAWSQGGDHFDPLKTARGLLRKAMNALFLRTDEPVTFLGRVNEDVSTYVVRGSRGDLFLTTMLVQLNQVATQAGEGGMTELYRSLGTYAKSFYTVMMAPSCVSIATIGRTDNRLHHRIVWDHAVPKVLSSRYRAADA